ncbi:hypothetical protein B0H11DRAFT_2384996 [Mycena galericulata]|nr:hypothetical protein B0H11DRAFT_2384996 [Mycena galericulata]
MAPILTAFCPVLCGLFLIVSQNYRHQEIIHPSSQESIRELDSSQYACLLYLSVPLFGVYQELLAVGEASEKTHRFHGSEWRGIDFDDGLEDKNMYSWRARARVERYNTYLWRLVEAKGGKKKSGISHHMAPTRVERRGVSPIDDVNHLNGDTEPYS